MYPLWITCRAGGRTTGIRDDGIACFLSRGCTGTGTIKQVTK
jgi:hypothetical protein